MTDGRSSAWPMRLLRIAGVVGLCLISGIVGGALNRNFGTSSYTLSYADFVSIMLTAVSLLITVLAVFLAIAGVIGWNSIEQRVHTKTEDFLSRGFEKGGHLDRMVYRRVKDVVESKTEEYMFDGVQEINSEDTRKAVEPKRADDEGVE
jgi:hypothetical protein